MPQIEARQVILKSRPHGMPEPGNFEVVPVTIPEPGEGQVQVRNIWMSVDPYMRGRMIERDSYVEAFKVGEPLSGGAIGQVVASNHKDFAVNDYVNNFNGWQEAFLSDGTGLTKVDPDIAPIQAFLGVLGMPGLTAYVGMTKIGQPKPGETVFVSAASGAVGSVVAQWARQQGCRVVGTAGSDAKCDWLKNDLGIDAAINYKTTANLEDALRAACPKGIDVYFDNVGGDHLVAAINLANPHARMPLCGMIAQYNETGVPEGPHNIVMAVPKRLRLEGFIVSDHFDAMGDFYRDVGPLVAQGKIRWKETVYEGIDNAAAAFIGLFRGENFGKALVKIGSDPAV